MTLLKVRAGAAWRRIILAAGIALFASLAITSIHRMAAIFDEGAQFPAGYSYWVFGDFRMNPEHPPLVKLLASFPLLFMDVTVHENDAAWRLGQQWNFGKEFLYSWNDGDRLLFFGRLMVVLLGCLLGGAVFWWAARLWGLAGAALSLLLFALSPDILAHGRIVTFDVAITLFFLLTVIAFERLTERVTWRRLLGAGLALGAAFATKESAIALLPILAVLAAWALVLPEPILLDLGARAPRALSARRDRLLCLALLLLAMGLLAVVVIWAVYGFHPHLSSDPAFQVDWARVWPEHAELAAAASLVKSWRLLPDGSDTRPDMVPPATWADDAPANPPLISRTMVSTPTTDILTCNAFRRVIEFSSPQPDEPSMVLPDGRQPWGSASSEAES